MVFQDPYSSMNAAFRVSHGIMRAIRLHRPDIPRTGRREEALRVMDAVGLRPAEVMLSKYPYELSGGQRQRVGFAQALVLRPKLILADEPVSMLDVSIRVGILNLMAELREREGVSILYITHDLASARYLADRVIVMYAGHVAEVARPSKCWRRRATRIRSSYCLPYPTPERRSSQTPLQTPASRRGSSTLRLGAASSPGAQLPSTGAGAPLRRSARWRPGSGPLATWLWRRPAARPGSLSLIEQGLSAGCWRRTVRLQRWGRFLTLFAHKPSQATRR